MKLMEKKTNVRKSFQKHFSELRAESGLSQAKLGKELGLSAATIGYYENGDRLPDIEIAARIATYFHVSVDYLLGLSECKSAEPDVQVACMVTGLSESSIETLQYIKENNCNLTILNYLLDRSERRRFESVLEHISFYCDSLAKQEIFIETAKEELKFTDKRECLAYEIYWDFSDLLVSWWHDFHERIQPKEEKNYLLPNFEDFSQFMRHEFYEYCIKESFGIIIKEITEKYIENKKSEKILHRCYVKALNVFPDIKEKYIYEIENMEKESNELRKIGIELNGKEVTSPYDTAKNKPE